MLLDSTGHPVAATPLSDGQVVQLMAEELRALAATRGPAILALPPDLFLRVVGLLQLASRHPNLGVTHSDTVAEFVAEAREYFATCPTVLEIIRFGADPACDRASDDDTGR